ncbi:MAG: hypothetical protein IGR92_10345 [Leptolyngbyaceae cyanobacterium T60_A2020_046]|nr:hypothetical protein [Leptolyngbyaceae cyanobacterium T60_A2020_046]
MLIFLNLTDRWHWGTLVDTDGWDGALCPALSISGSIQTELRVGVSEVAIAMPFDLFIEEASVIPLRALLFQSLLLLVAIMLEAMVLRQRMRWGFQPSIKYAATLNLMAVVIGWIVFLGIEPLFPPDLRTQVISYILFGHFYRNPWSGSLGTLIIGSGLVVFFVTFWIKAKGLEVLTWMMGNPLVSATKVPPSQRIRYGPKRSSAAATPPHTLAVLHANAWSFSAILVLLLLRHGLEVGL